MSPKRGYILTPRARTQLRKAKAWSRSRWDKELTQRYFEDVAAAAQRLSEEYELHRPRFELSGNAELGLFPVREHYLVYEPLKDGRIAIVDFIRQGRDVIAILNKHREVIGDEVKKLQDENKP